MYFKNCTLGTSALTRLLTLYCPPFFWLSGVSSYIATYNICFKIANDADGAVSCETGTHGLQWLVSLPAIHVEVAANEESCTSVLLCCYRG